MVLIYLRKRNTIKKNAESVIVGREQIRLHVNARKTVHMTIFDIRMQDEVTL